MLQSRCQLQQPPESLLEADSLRFLSLSLLLCLDFFSPMLQLLYVKLLMRSRHSGSAGTSTVSARALCTNLAAQRNRTVRCLHSWQETRRRGELTQEESANDDLLGLMSCSMESRCYRAAPDNACMSHIRCPLPADPGEICFPTPLHTNANVSSRRGGPLLR